MAPPSLQVWVNWLYKGRHYDFGPWTYGNLYIIRESIMRLIAYFLLQALKYHATYLPLITADMYN